ncbi:hypothetical protein Pyn_30026 [Prunus yedoensis var. nudiflora]|uniref:HHO5-like N-terminal domain-containing protein n=1 Tax=Prunus yedoensis var. nudiflora TaxID=2094558 RepID=A0A314ZH61_PRUYE|nr:hypothetical protein Pyn_30026 [Prunus yedoensis var. nudiflora]
MGSVPPKLKLDFRPTFVPKTISDFLKEVSMIGNVSERLSKLDDFVKRLEGRDEEDRCLQVRASSLHVSLE